MSVTDRGINHKTGKYYDLRYMARWRDPQGQWHTKCFRRKADADRHERAMRDQVRNGTYGISDKGTMRYLDFMLMVMAEEEGNRAPGTQLGGYTYINNYLGPLLGHVHMNRLDPIGDSKKLVGHMKKAGKAPSYIKAVLAAHKSFMRKGMARGYMPAGYIPRSKDLNLDVPRRRVTTVLEDEQVEALLAALPDRYRAPFMVYAYLGLRQGEGLGLTWDRVDLEEGVIIVDRQLAKQRGAGTFGKLKTTASYRTVPLPRPVVKALAAHKLAYGTSVEGLVFSNTVGSPLRHARAHEAIKAAAKAAGLSSKVSTHDLRHYFISCLRRDGMPDDQIAVIVGHENTREIIETYAHPFAGAGDRAREAMEGVMQRLEARRSQADCVQDAHGVVRQLR